MYIVVYIDIAGFDLHFKEFKKISFLTYLL
jgi:hypothetical protein